MCPRIAAIAEPVEQASRRCSAVSRADRLLDWHTDRANIALDLRSIHEIARLPLPDAALDLLDVAVATYVADIAAPRGVRERWPRDIELAVPVLAPHVWHDLRPMLTRLLYMLTGDRICLSFYPAPATPTSRCRPPTVSTRSEPDCVSLLSGGLDSLAGAVTLMRSGRRPMFVTHRSGNATTRAAQDISFQTVERHWPGASTTCAARVAPTVRGIGALPFPAPEAREPSRRARSLLFMALGLLAAEAVGVGEVFMWENGIINTGLPLAASRIGSLTTRSTHPAALALVNQIATRLGLRGRIVNPFVYETKSDLVRNVLAPHLSPRETQSTVSCWAAGRAARQCGGCVPCLIRRVAMNWANQPEEAYMIDLLGQPDRHLGTVAYGNLVDLLRHAQRLEEMTDPDIISGHPGLLALQTSGMEIAEVIALMRRHSQQTLEVVRERFPVAARLLA